MDNLALLYSIKNFVENGECDELIKEIEAKVKADELRNTIDSLVQMLGYKR